MKMNEFPTCNRKAPAAPYYAALHSMNRGPEGRSGIQASLLDNEIECFTMTSMNINSNESINVRIIFRSTLDKKPITDASR